MRPEDIAIAVPTYGRDEVLVATLDALLGQAVGTELVVVDQTPAHESAVQQKLESLASQQCIRWIRLAQPSIPHAMNTALLAATRPVVLFLDDDIQPCDGLVEAHAAAHAEPSTWAVVGRISQPPQERPGTGRYATAGLRAYLDFPFDSTEPAWINNVMAGNLSVRRARALDVGGFDENFVGAAFRFETEFCRRLVAAGGRVRFEPRARIHHLRAPKGGTRAFGNHLTSASPAHGVGDYYFALRQGLTLEALTYIAWRPLRQVRTRFHLQRPWWIAPKLVGEARALLLAIRLARAGPRYVAGPPRQSAA
jgi:GT2 family glycosyltransferase